MFRVLRLLFTLRVSVVENKQINKKQNKYFHSRKKYKIRNINIFPYLCYSRHAFLNEEVDTFINSAIEEFLDIKNQQVSCILFSVLDIISRSTFLFTALVLTTRDSPCHGDKRNRTKGVDWSKHLAFPYLVMKS